MTNNSLTTEYAAVLLNRRHLTGEIERVSQRRRIGLCEPRARASCRQMIDLMQTTAHTSISKLQPCDGELVQDQLNSKTIHSI